MIRIVESISLLHVCFPAFKLLSESKVPFYEKLFDTARRLRVAAAFFADAERSAEERFADA
jgi:hypothetical protein